MACAIVGELIFDEIHESSKIYCPRRFSVIQHTKCSGLALASIILGHHNLVYW